ncbi:urea ABC transporter permease subunit UrtC [Vreelandella boliviensis]|uniref:High-affinity branched-chain amino acid transport system permease protein livM n=1 Tax=Vreelandella boliviensis LC1 TaxID=1072583 RepID=A0A265DXW4_9GAMM|nr:urea ABC transporter permease subunit UrtC [Halomonas boliviensis]EHJ94479.1 High-affinity branched-chain amino acid transport system permease protein livM [Halomonas boliviensis LC1]OZT74173.1 urea ABC transporter permease subunit UrtC [Halomonas boliviensis LC1]
MSLTTESSTNFWLTRPFSERSTQIFLGVLLAALALVTILHVVVPPSNPLHVGAYTVNLFGKYLSYALLAVAVDLVWGYLGILSLGHGAFFAIGGYAMGMYLMRQIGERGTYGHPVLPDFMVFLNWDSLPWYWLGFDMAWFAFAMVLIAPGLLALVFGFLAFRSRVTGVYLSIITQALTFALMLAFFRNEMGFGGNNGLTDFRELLGYNLRSNDTRLGLFLATGVALGLGYILCRAIVTSKLGRVSIATRDAEARTRFLGYRVERFQLFVFVVSAMLAGLAGALYVPQVGIINPSEFSPIFSIEIVLWVALGGRATLYGAVIGAILVNYAKTIFTGVMPDAWLFALGAMFVLVTVFLPKGVAGLFHYLKRRKRDDTANNDPNADPTSKEASA